MLCHLASGCSLILLLTWQLPALAPPRSGINVADVVRGEIQSSRAAIVAKGRSRAGQASAPIRFLSPDGKHVALGAETPNLDAWLLENF